MALVCSHVPTTKRPAQAVGFSDLLERRSAQDQAIKENEERLALLRSATRQLSRRHELDIQERREAIIRRHQVECCIFSSPTKGGVLPPTDAPMALPTGTLPSSPSRPAVGGWRRGTAGGKHGHQLLSGGSPCHPHAAASPSECRDIISLGSEDRPTCVVCPSGLEVFRAAPQGLGHRGGNGAIQCWRPSAPGTAPRFCLVPGDRLACDSSAICEWERLQLVRPCPDGVAQVEALASAARLRAGGASSETSALQVLLCCLAGLLVPGRTSHAPRLRSPQGSMEEESLGKTYKILQQHVAAVRKLQEVLVRDRRDMDIIAQAAGHP